MLKIAYLERHLFGRPEATYYADSLLDAGQVTDAGTAATVTSINRWDRYNQEWASSGKRLPASAVCLYESVLEALYGHGCMVAELPLLQEGRQQLPLVQLPARDRAHEGPDPGFEWWRRTHYLTIRSDHVREANRSWTEVVIEGFGGRERIQQLDENCSSVSHAGRPDSMVDRFLPAETVALSGQPYSGYAWVSVETERGGLEDEVEDEEARSWRSHLEPSILGPTVLESLFRQQERTEGDMTFTHWKPTWSQSGSPTFLLDNSRSIEAAEKLLANTAFRYVAPVGSAELMPSQIPELELAKFLEDPPYPVVVAAEQSPYNVRQFYGHNVSYGSVQDAEAVRLNCVAIDSILQWPFNFARFIRVPWPAQLVFAGSARRDIQVPPGEVRICFPRDYRQTYGKKNVLLEWRKAMGKEDYIFYVNGGAMLEEFWRELLLPFAYEWPKWNEINNHWLATCRAAAEIQDARRVTEAADYALRKFDFDEDRERQNATFDALVEGISGEVREKVQEGVAKERAAYLAEIEELRNRVDDLEEQNANLMGAIRSVGFARDSRSLEQVPQNSQPGESNEPPATIAGLLEEAERLGFTVCEAARKIDKKRIDLKDATAVLGALSALADFHEARCGGDDVRLATWFDGKIGKYASGESESTMNKYGSYRSFRCGSEDIAMQAHLTIHNGKWHVHFQDRGPEHSMLIGRIGPHLPTVSDPQNK